MRVLLAAKDLYGYGGVNNVASGSAATVAGGNLNMAIGYASFAAGCGAHAANDGTD